MELCYGATVSAEAGINALSPRFFAPSKELSALRSSNGARWFGVGVLVSQTVPPKEIVGAPPQGYRGGPGSVWFVFDAVWLLHNLRRMLAGGCLSSLLAA